MMGGKVEDQDTASENKYGEPRKFDPAFKGPIQDRGCTDVICCIIFVICIIGMIGVGIFGYIRGDPERLIYPTDSAGNICGIGEYEDRPYLFFFDLLDCAKAGAAVIQVGCPTPQVCVDECPKKSWVWATQYAAETTGISSGTSGREDMICQYDIEPERSPKTVQQLIEDEDCAAYYVESEPILGRCVPAILNALADKTVGLVSGENNQTVVDKLNNTITGLDIEEGSRALAILLNAYEYGVKIYQDVRASWWMILVALAISMVISFIWIVLMRWIAGPMIWITLIVFLALFSFTTYYAFNRYVNMKDEVEHDLAGNIEFTTNLDYYTNLSVTWLVLGIVSAVFLFIVLVIVIFLRKRILIAIALIKESSKCVGNMIFTLFWPLIPFLLQIVVLAYWGSSALFLASMGEAQYGESNKTISNFTNATTGESQLSTHIDEIINEIPCDPGANDTAGDICSFLKYGGDEYTIYLQVFMLFMWLWVMNFIVALSHMTLAGAFASYYWAFNKPQDIPTFPVTSSLGRSVRYHLGSLAFGSLIIAIIQLIRIGLEYLDHKLKGAENKVAKFVLACLKCCFWCLEKFMKFLNKNAYIMIAIYGKNFCTAAKDAFFLIMRNIVRVVVVDKVTDFLLLVGKLMVVGAMATMAYFFFDGRISWVDTVITRPQLSFVLVPVIIIAVGSYIIAAAFFGVYNMAVDTLFLCFLEDLERNDGSPEKPYYMSKNLMEILGKKNDPEVEAAKND